MIRSFLRGFLAFIFASALVIAIVSYGAVQAFPLGIVALLLNVCLVVAVSAFGLPKPTLKLATIAMSLLVALTLWVILQTTPLADSWMAHPSWAELGSGTRATISVSPGDDWTALIAVSLPFSAFVVCLILFDTDKRAMRFLDALLIGCGLITFALLLQFVLDRDMLLFLEKRAYLGSFTGPFVNRNTAATLFGVAAVLSLALLWRCVAGLGIVAIFDMWMNSDRLPPGVSKPLFRSVLYAVLLALFLLALSLTKSRAGIGSCVAGLALFIGLRLARSGRSATDAASEFGFRADRSTLIRRGFIAIGLLGVAAFLGSQVLYRIEVTSRQDPRFCTAPAIMEGVTANLPFGAGLASFRDLFPTYRDPACGAEFVWNKAHNVYLEGTFALGVLFPILAVAVVWTLVRTLLVGMRTRRRYRSMSEAGLAILTIVLIHSCLDFSLQIPGFAMFFAAAMAPLATIARQRVSGARARGGTAGYLASRANAA